MGRRVLILAGEEKLYDAFLSHASSDEDVVRRVRDALHERGVRTFFSPVDMPHGKVRTSLARAVNASGALVLMVSASAANSDWVRFEAHIADTAELPIIPVFLEEVKLPTDNPLYFMTWEIHHIRLFPSFEDGLASLVRYFQPNGDTRPGDSRSAEQEVKPVLPPAAPAAAPESVEAPKPVPEAKAAPEPAAERASEPSKRKFDRRKFYLEVKTRADRGDREALYVLGRLYGDGIGVTKDESQAVRLFRLASEGDHGLPEAMHALANCYRKAIGVGRDFARMHSFFEAAAARGYAPSYYYLGRAYEAGWGVPVDLGRAYRRYLAAAKLGSAPAQYAVARMSMAGAGTPTNDANALSFAQMAAGQHYGPALNLMGRLHRKGRGVPQSDVEACKWYKLGAEQGDPDAAFNLGSMYERGLGVEVDKELAAALFRLSQALRAE